MYRYYYYYYYCTTGMYIRRAAVGRQAVHSLHLLLPGNEAPGPGPRERHNIHTHTERERRRKEHKRCGL